MLLLCGNSAFADDSTAVTAITGAANAQSIVSGDAALAIIQALFVDRVSSFSPLGDLSGVIQDPGSDTLPPVLDCGTTATFGHLYADMGVLPDGFMSCIGILINILASWMAFSIVVRP